MLGKAVFVFWPAYLPPNRVGFISERAQMRNRRDSNSGPIRRNRPHGTVAPRELPGLLRASENGVASPTCRHRRRELEDQGYFLVVAKLEVKYKLPAHYDDVLTIRTTVRRASPVRIGTQVRGVPRRRACLCEGNLDTSRAVRRRETALRMPAWLHEG